MWRWSYREAKTLLLCGVFSTYVEVIPGQVWLPIHYGCILHVCGGDPTCLFIFGWKFKYSPRMWRWSLDANCIRVWTRVFSTYVEVILEMNDIKILGRSILHVCGGDPDWTSNLYWCWGYSPRMWRWSLRGIDQKETITVFSTHVESVTVLERTDK